MGLFSKNKEQKEPTLPKLPELPSLPSKFPEMDKDYSESEIHELPSFPNSQMGDRFSQETIKKAVSGKDFEDDEDEEPEQIIPKPKFDSIPNKIKKQELKSSPESTISRMESEPIGSKGPVFIQITKFEEALKVFNETKEKINEVEKLLEETKELKKKEDEELSTWETELQETKQRIEKVNEDIFSKI